jgi:MFS transporter, FSR family, fosmidomycin resistance protein
MDTEPKTIEKDFQAGGVALVSTTHAIHDTYTAFLPALLPVLIQKFTLTNTLAGLLSLFLQIPSLLQPVIGHIADRKNLELLVIFTPAITGAAMSLLGIAPSYGIAAFLLVIAGISSAMLHAVGPVLGSALSGAKIGRGMSFWMVGGELGRAVGPILVVTIISYLSVGHLPWLMLAGVLLSAVLFGKLGSLSTKPAEGKVSIPLKSALFQMRKVMLPLVALLFARSMVSATLTTFLPTFLTNEGSSLWVAGASLTILEVAGMLGAFLAGSFSDRFGRRRMLAISFTATPVLMLLFIFASNSLRIPLLVLLGFFAISVVPVIMAIVLENAPENRSLANGIYMAASFILNALSILLVGFLSDLVDLRFTFIISAVLLPIGLPFIFFLPKSNRIS